MSIISLQIGQCGNQIGDSFFSTIVDDLNEKKSGCSKQYNLKYATKVCSQFFTESHDGKKLIANSVQIDMERKVINNITTNKNRIWGYSDSSCFYGDFGCGNNWANGFYGYGREHSLKIMDMIRKKAEQFDRIEGFLVNMSVAGGTGSGLGSLVTRMVREDYRHDTIINQIVWPFSSGEVSVQSYNTLLTLNSLYQSSDALIVVENDGVWKLCSRYAGQYKVPSKNSMGFQMINNVVSRQFSSVILPAGYIDIERPTKLNHSLNKILELMTPDPDLKLLNIRSVPHSSYSSRAFEFHQWDGLVRYLRQMLFSNSHVDQDIDWSKSSDSSRALCSMLFLRGNDIHRFNTKSLKSPHGNRFGAFGDSLTIWGNGRSFAGNDKFASVLTNGQSLLPVIDRTVDKAWRMFAYRAFVHQYERQGMESEDFMRAFAQLELILKNYKKIL